MDDFVSILTFVGHNGVEIKENFEVLKVNIGSESKKKKSLNTFVLEHGFLSSSFLEEIRYNEEVEEDDIPYSRVSVYSELLKKTFVFTDVSFKKFEFDKDKAFFSVVFYFDGCE